MSKLFKIERPWGWRLNAAWLLLAAAGLAALVTFVEAESEGSKAASYKSLLLFLVVPFATVPSNVASWPNDAQMRWLRGTPWRRGRRLPTGTPCVRLWGWLWVLATGAAVSVYLASPAGGGHTMAVVLWVGVATVCLWAVVIIAAYGLLAAPAGDDPIRRGVRFAHWIFLLAGVWLAARWDEYGIAPLVAVWLGACLVAGMIGCSVAGYWRAWATLPRRVLEPDDGPAMSRPAATEADRLKLARAAGVLPMAPVATPPRPEQWLVLLNGLAYAGVCGLVVTLLAAAAHAMGHNMPVMAKPLVMCGLLLAVGISLVRVAWNLDAGTYLGPPPPLRWVKWPASLTWRRAWRPFWIGVGASSIACLSANAAEWHAPEVAGHTVAAAVFVAATVRPSRRWNETCGDGIVRAKFERFSTFIP